MVLSRGVNKRVFIERPNQRRAWRPLFIVRKNAFGNYKIRIDGLNVQVLGREPGFLEVQTLRRTHGATILDKNHVAHILSRRNFPALCLNLPRPWGFTSKTGAHADTE